MNPGRSDQAASDEGQIVIEGLGSFNHSVSMLICNIDDILSGGNPCSDGNTHTNSTENSLMANEIAGSGNLHELFSNEKEVEFCSCDPQQTLKTVDVNRASQGRP